MILRIWRFLLRFFLPPLIIAGTITISVWLIITREQLEPQAVQQRVIPVDVARVKLQSATIILNSWGKVQPHIITGVTAEVEGRIVEVAPVFVNGGFAKTGEVLLKIDDRDYQTALRRARAQLASARSSLAQEQGRGIVARRDWQSRSNGNSDDEASALALRKPQLAEAMANLEAAEANEQEALLNLERTVIRAPFDGLVLKQQVNLGQYVRSGEMLGEIHSIESAEIRLPIPDNRLGYISLPGIKGGKQPQATLSIKIGDSLHHWPAKIVRTEEMFDERSLTLFAIAKVVDPYGLHSDRNDYTPLRFGAFVTARINGKVFDNLVRLPRTLLRTGNQLWVVDKKNRLQNRRVKVLNTDTKLMYVSGGLQNDDRICLSPISNALPNTPVEVLKEISTDKWHTSKDVDLENNPPPLKGG